MKFYRYESQEYASMGIDGEYESSSVPHPRLELRTFEMVKETPKGYWISLYGLSYSKKRWISKTSRKRFAYPTEEEALRNFIYRCKYRSKILNYQKWSTDISISLGEALMKTKFPENDNG